MRRNKSRKQRSGVILIVVLSMLTLLALVGLTFVLVADTASPALRPFREDAVALAGDTREAAAVARNDLLDSFSGEADFSASRAALADLARRTEEFKARVRAASDGSDHPATRRQLKKLCGTLEELVETFDLLDRLIQMIEPSRE
jgi:hypothetical protein